MSVQCIFCIADNVYLFDATFIGVSKIADDF